MAIRLETIEKLYKLKDQTNNLDIISIGDHIPNFDYIPKKIIKDFNLPADINSFRNKTNSKEYIDKIIKNLGYNSICFIDNFPKSKASYVTDFEINLSEKNATESIKKKFGIIIDNGTSLYVSNILNAFDNIANLVDSGGYIITNICPLSFNRYPFQPSPENLVDYFYSKKFICTSLEFSFDKKNKLPKKKKYYMNVYNKHYFIFQSFNILEFIFYLRFLLVNYFFSKRVTESHIFLEDYPSLKLKNFSINNKITNSSNNTKNKIKLILKKLGIFNLTKCTYNILKKYIYIDKNRGRVSIDFTFKKDENIVSNEFISSTIHYEARWKK